MRRIADRTPALSRRNHHVSRRTLLDQRTLRVRGKSINITLPGRILDAVDRCARERGKTGCGLHEQALPQSGSRNVRGKNIG